MSSTRRILERQIGPVKALCHEKERVLRVLEQQQRFKDDAADMERRIAEQCRKLSRKLETLDFEAKRSMLGAFGLKVEATRDEASITLVVDPNFTTTEQTLALLPWRKAPLSVIPWSAPYCRRTYWHQSTRCRVRPVTW